MRSIRYACLGLALGLALAAPAVPARARQQLAPADTVLAFYRLLREQRYLEGFAYSVYREAVEGLSEEELVELTPDFQETFSEIPAKIEVRGTQAGADTATVFVSFGGDAVDEVALVKEEGRWLVGDREALEQVRRERTEFFFNARVRVNQNEVFRLLKRIVGAEEVHFQAKKSYATLEELAAVEGLADDFEGGRASGYRFFVNLTPQRDAFTVVAIPVRYGRTGKLSFFADAKNVHAADAQGMPVNEQAPVLAEQEVAVPAP